MEAEPVQSLSASISYRSGASEDAIELCEKLLSAGRPFSEILIALKQLGRRDELDPLDRGNGLSRNVGMLAVFGNADAALVEPRSHITSGALVIAGAKDDVAHRLVSLPLPPSLWPDCATRGKSSSLLAAALLWLIPAIALTVVGISSKLLMDVHSRRNAVATLSQAEEPALRAVILEPIRTAPMPTPENPEPARAADPVLTGSSAVPASEAAVTSPSGIRHNRFSNPRAEMLPRAAPIQRQWIIPRRLTDGF